jgi:type VI protein secretion system component Hcp
MSNRVGVVLSIAAGLVLTGACIAFAAYEFYGPGWRVEVKGGFPKAPELKYLKIDGVRSDIAGMPPLLELKGEYRVYDKWGKLTPPTGYLKYESMKSNMKGSAEAGQVVLLRTPDKLSQRLAALCVQDDPLGDIVLLASRGGGGGQSLQYTLHNAYISSFLLRSPRAGGEQLPREEVTFKYSRIEWTWVNTRRVFPKVEMQDMP